jgi:hypothetical protein
LGSCPIVSLALLAADAAESIRVVVLKALAQIEIMVTVLNIFAIETVVRVAACDRESAFLLVC